MPKNWPSFAYQKIVNGEGVPSEEIMREQAGRHNGQSQHPGDELLTRARQLAEQMSGGVGRAACESAVCQARRSHATGESPAVDVQMLTLFRSQVRTGYGGPKSRKKECAECLVVHRGSN